MPRRVAVSFTATPLSTCRIRIGSVLVTATYGHYGHLWPLRPSCSQNRAGSYMPDPTFRIPFGSVLSKKPGHIVQTGPDLIRSGWPGQVLAKRMWSGSKPMCKNHRARFLAEHNRPATSFPLLYSVLQTARITLCKTSPDPIWFWLTVSGFVQTDPVRKRAGVQQLSGPLLANASEPS